MTIKLWHNNKNMVENLIENIENSIDKTEEGFIY